MLFNIPSPTHEAVIPFIHKKIFVKRDDLIHPYISGNKWRKLKYIIQQAKLEKKNHLVSFGGAYSNHILALSTVGHIHGLVTTGIIRGDEFIDNEVLKHCRSYGMQIIHVSRNAYRNKLAIFQHFFRADDQAFFIDEGGMHEAALLGVDELLDEIDTRQFDHIFTACGTGTTICGLAQRALHPLLHGVLIIKTTKEHFVKEQAIMKYAKHPIILYDQFHHNGYSKKSPPLLTFIKEWNTINQVKIEPIYTGKVAYAIMTMIQKNEISYNDHILLLHTGGILESAII